MATFVSPVTWKLLPGFQNQSMQPRCLLSLPYLLRACVHFQLESPEEMLWSYTPLSLKNLMNKLEGSELTGLGPADEGGRWGAVRSHNTNSSWWGGLSLRQTDVLGAGALRGVCWAWEWLKTVGCGSTLTMIEWQLSYIMSATDGLMPEHWWADARAQP